MRVCILTPCSSRQNVSRYTSDGRQTQSVRDDQIHQSSINWIITIAYILSVTRGESLSTVRLRSGSATKTIKYDITLMKLTVFETVQCCYCTRTLVYLYTCFWRAWRLRWTDGDPFFIQSVLDAFTFSALTIYSRKEFQWLITLWLKKFLYAI